MKTHAAVEQRRALYQAAVVTQDAKQVAALKIRFMVSNGWKPSEAWFEGRLPFHDYLDVNLIEAAWACGEGGTDPHEPMRADGLQPPTKLLGWAEFEARLVAQERKKQAEGKVVRLDHQRLRA